jgi:signal transduction histidine kinase
LEDGQGNLWIGSTAGLMRLKKEELNRFVEDKTAPISCRVYGEPDGLPASECTSGSQPGAVRSRDGMLWFPTIQGLASLNPARLNVNTNPPPVVIESVLVAGEVQNLDTLRSAPPREITIPPGKEGLEIRYASLNLAAPDKGRFEYMLEGYDTIPKSRPGYLREAPYNKLPPGPYVFRVRACNEDDVWSTEWATLSIKVLPPFWRTWWFLSLTTMGLLGMIVGSVHYVSTQRLQRQVAALRQKEALEKERARIARDIHDQVGANLTQLSLLGELVESDKDDPKEVEDHARHIEQTALETTRALDEIVWTVNPSNDTLDGLINYVCKYAQDYLALAALRYRLEVPPQLPNIPISPELRHNVFLAAKEAVNNVVKHSQAKSAWLRLRLEPGRFTLEIEDNGRGLSPGAPDKGRNGLRNMRKRMEDVGGEFGIGPGAEGGTRVSLTAPLGRATGDEG